MNWIPSYGNGWVHEFICSRHVKCFFICINVYHIHGARGMRIKTGHFSEIEVERFSFRKDFLQRSYKFLSRECWFIGEGIKKDTIKAKCESFSRIQIRVSTCWENRTKCHCVSTRTSNLSMISEVTASTNCISWRSILERTLNLRNLTNDSCVNRFSDLNVFIDFSSTGAFQMK